MHIGEMCYTKLNLCVDVTQLKAFWFKHNIQKNTGELSSETKRNKHQTGLDRQELLHSVSIVKIGTSQCLLDERRIIIVVVW